MTLKKIFFYLIFSIFYAVEAADSTELLFFKKGVALKTMNLEALKKSHKDEILKVFEPHENSQKEYKGFLMLPLLDSVYGKNQNPSLDTVVFYCTDGYRSDIPLEEFKAKKATLSFAMADGSPFFLKTEKSIPLGPFYLTWDHPDAASAKKNFFRWPYGINKIDFIHGAGAYKPLLPSETSSANIKSGHNEFIKHCFSCHTVNEVGGLRGPPLNYFIQAKTTSELESYILNPKAFNKNSQMSGLPILLKDRQKIAADIVGYLKKQTQLKKAGE